MKPAEEPAPELTCKDCATVLEVCSFCEQTRCRHPICFRCLRFQLGESLAHPHSHGG